MADATKHFAGKKLFAKFDCSQAYYAMQMADEQSVQLLAFNFGARTFAYQRLAQGLSRSVSAFSSYVREKLGPVIAADRAFSYMDDITSAANGFAELLGNLRELFSHLRDSGLKLSVDKCQIGLEKIDFLGSSMTSQGISPCIPKVEKFLSTLKMPQTKKQIKRLAGFFQFYRQYLPNLAETLLPFYKLLRDTSEFLITEEHHTAMEKLTTGLKNACEMTLRLPMADKQYVIMADASWHAAGYVLMIEDYTKNEKGKEVRTYAPVAFGSKTFAPAQVKYSIYAKEFLAVSFAFDAFAHAIWGSSKPVLVLTDNKSLTRFFQAKSIPAALWNCVDQVLSFKFEIGHIPGKANLAADYLSRIPTSPQEKIQLKMDSTVPLRTMEVNFEAKTPNDDLNLLEASKTKINSLATLCSEYDDDDDEPLEIEERIQLTRPSKSINALNEQNPLDSFPVDDKMEALDMRTEQAKDDNIRAVMEWIRTKDTPDTRYASIELQKYKKQFPRLTVQDGTMYRKFFDDTGRNYHLQLVVPKHLREELLYRLHNSKLMGHQGVTKTVQEFRKHYYFPSFTEHLIDYIKNCSSCLQVKPPSKSSLRAPLQPISSLQDKPGDLMQIDLVGRLNPSNGFTHIPTGMDVFTKYLFAIPLRTADATSVENALFHVLMTHSYIPRIIITDLGSVFVGKMMAELCKLLEIQIDHATLKHAQTIGALERSHASIKHFLKIHNDNKEPRGSHSLVEMAAFVHNTTFQTSIGCTPTLLFHGREPVKPLDMRFANPTMKNGTMKLPVPAEKQDALNELYAQTKNNLIASYNQYRGYYDRKANAAPLPVHSYCLLMDHTIVNSNDFAAKGKCIWLPLYRVEQVVTNSNYVVRKVNTNFCTIVNRMRLSPITPQYTVKDLE
jgi:hypothetical protein